MRRDLVGVGDQANLLKRPQHPLQTLAPSQTPNGRLAIADDVHVDHCWHMQIFMLISFR